MGKYDSSLTRVQPIFNSLLEKDPTGTTWVPNLLRCAPRAHELDADVLADPGPLTADANPMFEYPAPPSADFLRWLIDHPDQMTWPKTGGVEAQFGQDTQDRRERLVGRHGTEEQRLAQQKALAELDRVGAKGSARRWWAFEGVTKVDFSIHTERLVVFVEGKRTEKLSRSTDWFPRRSQLVRNMEVVGDVAGPRASGVLLAVEEPLPDLDDQTIEESTPHLSPAERKIVSSRYLGQVRWQDICDACGLDFSALPDTVP